MTKPAYCPSCGLPLQHSAEEAEKQISEDITESGIQAEDEEDKEAIRELKQLLDNNPSLKNELIGE